MKKTSAKCVALLAALGCAGAIQAHHSGYMYESVPVWIEGTVTRVERVNPHTLITLEGRTEDGQARRWAVEGPGQSQLDRRGLATLMPEVGDVLEFCAFPYKSAEELSRIFPEADFSGRRSARAANGSSPEFVAGHVMVMPDGEMQLWEPHGLISECIRSSGIERLSWLGFLNTNAGARRAWCEQRRYAHVESTASLQELVEEIDDLLEDSCD